MATNQLVFRIVGWTFLGLGGFICALNFYLSFVRYPLLRKLGRKGEIRWISGFPFLGTVMVLYVFFHPLPVWAKIGGLVLVAIDTGGPHWFLASVVRMARKKSSPQRK